MKIITWNCNGAFRNKYNFLNSLDWDIAVIQECENPHYNKEFKKASESLGCHIWTGRNKNKGLAIFARNYNEITIDNRYSNISSEFCRYGDSIHELDYFLPIQINGITIIACWCHIGNDYVFRYIGQLWKYLLLNSHLIDSNTIFIGDFNANKIWDQDHSSWMNFSAVNKIFNDKGLYSFYHYFMQEEFGKEKVPTFYLHKNPEKPYHIDYAYGNIQRLKKIKVLEIPMKNNKYLSDHTPLYIQIE